MEQFLMQKCILFCGVVLLFSCLTESHLFVKDGFVGIGIDLSKLGIGGKCPPEVPVTCPCGKAQALFNVTIPICSYGSAWKTKCKPCDDLQEEDVCPRYKNCEQCKLDAVYAQDSCATCPEGHFGTWCENKCSCQNEGICERNGKCTCNEAFEGRKCERKKGCPLPAPIQPPLLMVGTPSDRPSTLVYSCPSTHELKGSSISTCLQNKKWSSSPPLCLPKCPLLSAPASGRLLFSANELVEGVEATVTCNPYHRMIGEETLTCQADGNWSGELPICEKLATCPDPGLIPNGDREIPSESVKLGGHFVQDSRLVYSCHSVYEQLGEGTILCRFDGTWSNQLPSCIKVSTVVPTCDTKGSEIVSNEGVSVRIVCPPECADVDDVWGTSIYRHDSSVCAAAIHSAKLTNIGGPVAVINNGDYSQFTGSQSNNVLTHSYEGRAQSFRFDKLPQLNRTGYSIDCDRGLIRLDHTCVYLSNNRRPFVETEGVCANMGLRMKVPESAQDRLKLIMLMNERDIKSVWSLDKSTQIWDDMDVKNTSEFFRSNLTDYDYSDDSCTKLSPYHLELKTARTGCDEFLHFMCVQESEGSAFATCDDIGNLTNGFVKAFGKMDDKFYVGSSVEFSCEPLHYLKGPNSISCLANSSWSDNKPVCVKVNACEDPPMPSNAFVTYLAPLKTQTEQRAAIHTSSLGTRRMARLPAGLSAVLHAPPENSLEPTTPEPAVNLPQGLHRVGSRAMFTCESRYYKLIGSGTRRCQGEGLWSGRTPTCIPVCGRSDIPRLPFVVNGNATDIGQWPWQGGLARYLPDYKQWFLLCGASLLNERWLITAAHCVTYAGTTLPIEADKFQAYLGKYHRQDTKDDEYVQVKKIDEIHIHPDYDPGLFDADIALLHLTTAVKLNTRVQPVCLPTEQVSRENLAEGQKGVVTGWGMNENGTYSDTLQQAVLPVVSRSNCEQGYEESDLPLTVTENMFCAGFAAGRSDACSGDSGGPMVFPEVVGRDRKWVLEGIVSWGSPQGCGNPKQYGGFTTVSRFLDWIHLFV